VLDGPRSGYSLDRKLGGPRAGLDIGQNINICCTAGNRTAIPRSSDPSLYYLSYLGCHICIHVCMYVCVSVCICVYMCVSMYAGPY
jgi:hypothetical protein